MQLYGKVLRVAPFSSTRPTSARAFLAQFGYDSMDLKAILKMSVNSTMIEKLIQ